MNQFPRFCSFLAAVIAASLTQIPAQSRASTIVDTGHADPGVAKALLSLSPADQLAAQFTLLTPTTITSVEGWIGSLTPDTPRSITIGLGAAPGSTTFSGHFQPVGGSIVGDSTSQWQGVFDLNWNLDAGTYWVSFIADPELYPALYAWMASDVPNPLPLYAYRTPFSSDAWNQPGLDFGVRINGDASIQVVPESSTTVALLGLTVAALFYIRRKSSSQ